MKIDTNIEDWQFGKVIGILQALICLVKLLMDLTSFLYLGHTYNLDFIISIISF